MAPNDPDERARGLGYALAAYLAWGLFPIYFKALRGVPAVEVLAHRVVWSLFLLAGLVLVRGGAAALRAPFRRDRLPLLAVTTALISTNWLVYIWAVQVGRVLEASLGYFVNPLVNVVLGVLFLGESLSAVKSGDGVRYRISGPLPFSCSGRVVSSRISYFLSPMGNCTPTSSPTCLPMRARPIGEAMEMWPASRSM